MNRRNSRALPIVVGLLITGASIVGHQLFWPNYQQQWEAKERQLAQLENQNNRLLQKQSAHQQSADKLLKHDQQRQFLFRRFEFACDSSCVVHFLTAAAERTGIYIDVFEWQDREQNENWIFTPFHLVLRGEYGSLLGFFEQLNDAKFIIAFEQLDLHRTSVDGKQVELIAQASLMQPTSLEEKIE